LSQKTKARRKEDKGGSDYEEKSRETRGKEPLRMGITSKQVGKTVL